MTKGFVYVFLRKDGAPLPTGCAGHVGWGFAVQNGPNDLDAVCGSTENFKGEYHVPAGGDIGFWWKRFRTDIEMFKEKTKKYSKYELRIFNQLSLCPYFLQLISKLVPRHLDVPHKGLM